MEWVRILFFLVITIGSLYLFWTALYRKYRYVMAGREEKRGEGRNERIRSLFRDVLFQRKVMAEPAGIGHAFIFWGFIVLSFGTLEFMVNHIFHTHVIWIGKAHWFIFAHEMFSVLVMVAILVAAGRRYFIKPMRLDATAEAYVILGLIAGLVVTDMVVSGIEVALGGEDLGWVAPIASGLGALMTGGNETVLKVLEEILVWAHLGFLFGFLIFIPRSKHLHMIAAMFNTYFRRLTSPGQMRTIDLSDETVEEFGVGRIDQFTWKQLLDGYACTECGRCHVNCPATLTGKPLSPKYLILKMRDHLTEVGDQLLVEKMATAGVGGANVEAAATSATATAIEIPQLIGNVYSEDEIWSCTTCRACEEACPVYNEHVDKILDLRRYMVLTEGKASPEINRAFQNLERQSNEWGQNRNTRADWAKDLDVRTMAEVDGQVEYLYYVGSAVSFDPRNQKIAKAFVNLLNKAGIDFAILGKEEESDGESARRLGNEFLFQSLAETNIEICKAYNVKKIITTDPHAYNTFKNEYPEFGLEAEVIHSTEFLARLLEEEKLVPSREVNEVVTFHDPCNLGRYNGVYSAPRLILESIPGIQLVEMERSKENGMCCGAGGGNFWKEELPGTERINVLRTEQVIETSATIIGTACPFCMTMMIDGTKAKGVEETISTYDVVELLDMSVA